MPIQILSTFVRKGVGNYPLLEDLDIKGGFRVVPTILDRDTIPSAMRKEGMYVYVVSTALIYKLLADLNTWTTVVLGSTSTGNIGEYICDSSLTVLDVVYLSAADTVDLADANGIGTQPVVGFILEKPTPTTAKVQYSGEIDGFTGLIVGATYYLSEIPGQITDESPTVSGSIVQRVGFAKNTTTLVVMIDRDYTIL